MLVYYKDGQASYKVYGENGKELHTYEVGSLTKTYTAVLINKAINEEKIKGKNVLIIDDVFTTGQTINLSSEMLIESGADGVYFMSLASTEDDG